MNNIATTIKATQAHIVLQKFQIFTSIYNSLHFPVEMQ